MKTNYIAILLFGGISFAICFGDGEICSNEGPVQCSSVTPQSLDALNNARDKWGSEARPDGPFPSWIDLDLARKGQQFANDYLFAIIFSQFQSLIGLLGHPDLTQVLSFSGSSLNQQDTLKRYSATATQVIVWYQDFLNDDSDDNIRCSLQKVHAIHQANTNAAVAQKAATGHIMPQNFWDDYTLTTALIGPFFADLNTLDWPAEGKLPPPSMWANTTATSVPMNQQTFVLTQFAFMGYILAFPEQMHITQATEEELWAFNHLWAVIGYAMGIEDELNLAIQPDLETAQEVYRKVWETYDVPILYNLDHNGKSLIEFFATLTGNQITASSIMYRFLKDVLQLPATNTFNAMSVQDKLAAISLEAAMTGYEISAVERATMNLALWNALYAAGTLLYQTNYTTQESRARNVYFAKYMDDGEGFEGCPFW